MASNKTVTIGPISITNTVTNLIGPPSLTLSGGANIPPPATTWISYYIIRHIRFVNTDSSARTVTLYKTSTGDSTLAKTIIGSGLSIAANSPYDWYGMLRIQSDELDKFITGVASVTNVVIMNAEAEVGIV